MKSLIPLFMLLSGVIVAQPLDHPKITTETSGNVKKHRVEGSLAATQAVGCIPLIEAKNTFTPPDLYHGVEACIAQGNYQFAAQLFALAGIYASFDEDRIADKTVEDARQVLIMNTFETMTKDKKARFSESFNRLVKEPNQLRNLCHEVQRIGSPNYYPNYMILYGMNAFTGNPHKNALVKDFDAPSVWRKLQTEYLHCPD